MNNYLRLLNINTSEFVSLVLLLTLIVFVCSLAALSIYSAVQRNRSEGRDCFLRYLSPMGWTSIALSLTGLFCAGCIASRAVPISDGCLSAQRLGSMHTRHDRQTLRMSVDANRSVVR